MNRREFFKLTGLGAAGLLLVPAVASAAWTEPWEAGSVVERAVAFALARGARYADARVGRCAVSGGREGQAALDLFEADLLGLRYQDARGWRQVLVRPCDGEAELDALLQAAMDAPALPAAGRDYWIAASYDTADVRASKSSDSTVAAQFQGTALRYARRSDLPAQLRDIHFCDFILQH